MIYTNRCECLTAKKHQLLVFLHHLGVIIPLPRSGATSQAQHCLGGPVFTNSVHLGAFTPFHFFFPSTTVVFGGRCGVGGWLALWCGGMVVAVIGDGAAGPTLSPGRSREPRQGSGTGPLRPHGSALAALSFLSQLRPPAGL